jgi:hypothetical protein
MKAKGTAQFQATLARFNRLFQEIKPAWLATFKLNESIVILVSALV